MHRGRHRHRHIPPPTLAIASQRSREELHGIVGFSRRCVPITFLRSHLRTIYTYSAVWPGLLCVVVVLHCTLFVDACVICFFSLSDCVNRWAAGRRGCAN